MTKRLNTEHIASELAESAFFPPRPAPVIPPAPALEPHPTQSAADDAMTSRPQSVMTPKRHDVTTSPPHDAKSLPQQSATATPPPLDIYETPHRDFTLRTTEAEYEALDDLERELRRRFGIATSKNTLIRCGIHYIAENLAIAKEDSVVIQKLTAKPTAS